MRNRELEECDMIITIPASENYPSLNISHAAATIFYELYTSTNDALKESLANKNVRDVLLRFLESSALSAGLSKEEVGLATRAFKNIMGRSAIRSREASAIAGTLRAIATELNDRSYSSFGQIE